MSDISLTFEEKLDLRSWGLPEHILEKYLLKGVKKMFPWQVECLMSGDVLLGGNLIYSAPTSAGKTLVAEMLAIKTVLERRKKVIIILPFVSVVREKMIYFQEIFSGSGIRVEGFMGSYNPPGGFRSVHLAICTIEKANSLINRLLEERNLDDIGAVIVDELHLLGDAHRGYLLELLLTKLKFICQKGLSANIQIIGMSATLPNLDMLASWLNATLYRTDFRPIPLCEYLKVGRTVYKFPDMNQSFEIKPEVDIQNDPGDVVYLSLDTIRKGYSLLIFCPTKNWCETLAVQISSEIKRIGSEKNSIGISLRSELNPSGISDILEQLKKCPAGLERNLGQSVSFGVAYHHAGLTLEERDIVEGGFKQNLIRVLVATSTLSSGVNLPARRVIIRSPGFQGHCMDILTYKQMIGRAGRMGKDTAGESYVICTESEKGWGKQLLTSELPPVESCLGKGNLSNSLKRALLEVTACGMVSTVTEMEEYTKCTLLAASASEEKISKAISSCTNYLQENEFIKLNLDGNILPSSLAEACLGASVPPDQALYLLRELHKARQCFVLDSDLHAIYQVTPYSICDYWAVDWMRYFTIWENLPTNLQKIGELIGIEDRFLIKAMRGTINLNADEFVQKVSIHKRFYTALALQDLINEVPLNQVALKYDCNKGMLQSLQQSASTFAAMVTSFCKRLGWGGLEVLLAELSSRIQFGVQKELLDLLRLDCMTALMARALFNASITSVTDLASSSPSSILVAIRKAKPFQSEVIGNKEEKKNIYVPGRPGLSEAQAANLLIQEARRFLLKEMGVKAAEWEASNVESVSNSVYERSTIFDSEPQNNTNSNIVIRDAHTEDNEDSHKQSIVNENQPINIDNDLTNIAEISNVNRLSSVSPRNIDLTSEEVFAIEKVEAPTTTILPELDEKKIEFPEPQNVTFSLKTVSPFLGMNGENSKHNIIFNLSPKNFNESFKSEKGVKKDFAELDDTELIDSEFVSRIIDRNVNKTKYFHRLDNSIGDNLQQPRKESDNFPLNFSNNSKFSAFDILEVEKRFFQEERGNQYNKEVNYTSENIPVKYSCTNHKFKEHLSLIHRISDATIPTNHSVNFFDSPKSLFQSPIQNDKDIVSIPSKLNDQINPQNANLNCSTPVTNHSHDGANLSNNDMFSDSPLTHYSSIRPEIDCIKNQTLEEFDINWGGDSLLEFSQIETKNFETNPGKNVLKRKLSDSIEELNYSRKKIWLPLEKDKFSYSKKSYLSEIKEKCIVKESLTKSYFHDSMPFNSQLENLISENEKFGKRSSSRNNFERNKSEVSFKSESPNMDYLKMKGRPKSEGNISSKTLVEIKDKSLRETLISNTFNATFKYKLSEMLNNSLKEEFNINNTNSNKDDFDKLDLSISDSEDFITESPEQLKKHKTDFSLKSSSASSNALGRFSSPTKVVSKSSPAKHDSPAKYPPIGGDIIKLTKSPVSKKCFNKTKSISPSQKHEHRSTRCLMSEFVKKYDDVPIITVDESVINAKDIIANILHSKEVSFFIEIKDISESEIQKNKIGNKILRSINNLEKMQYKCYSGDMAIVRISFFNGKAVYDLDMTLGGTKCNLILREVFSNRDLILCGIDTKKKFRVLFNCCKIIVECETFDVGIAEWLLEPGEKYKSLKELAKELLGKSIPIDGEINNKIRQELITLKELQVELTKRLKEHGLEKLFYEVEIPIQKCLLSMELTGIGFDQKVVNNLWSLSTELMGTLEIAAFTLAKQKFSLSSNVEFSKVKRKLKILPEQENSNPFIDIVRNWRKLHSLKTKNLSQLLLETKNQCYCHSSTKTVTGRIVLYDPDLQHIPRDFDVNEKLFSLRSAFIARPGNVLVSADYGQLELRILAHFSQDPVLIPLLRQNDDVFKIIAAEWNNISKEMVTEEMRHQVKQICYGIIYGMGDKTLGEALGKTATEASMLSAQFKRTFPKINDFINKTVTECRQAGKITTLAGRVRYLPEINSNITHCRAQAERQAVNSKIQGSAADIAKKAMVNIEERLNNKFLDRKLLPTAEHSSHLILQLHDELIFEKLFKIVPYWLNLLLENTFSLRRITINTTYNYTTPQVWCSYFPHLS
ncbi:DNA polymerase theta isoform X2 [Halyomorpha halys]|uniref:DNA polymerase theta isoform X2 n=1 Tax=Halyomorpha halys TaxID=286706 RepID=UPI0034D1FD26